MFAVVALADRHRLLYWPAVLLLLMTKEDMPIYVAAFGALQIARFRNQRRRAILTIALAGLWFSVAMFVAIPASRLHDRMPPSNPLLEARFGSPSGGFDSAELTGRLLSRRSLGTAFNLLSMTGFSCLAGGIWLLPALPGIAINMSAAPDTLQKALMDHYAWPILPWLFMASAAGVLWFWHRFRRVTIAVLGVLLVVTAIDNPALQRLPRTRINPEATVILQQLRGVQGTMILAQPNLIPHLPRSRQLFAIGAPHQPTREPDLVLLTQVGGPWPLQPGEVSALITQYENNSRYEAIVHGPLYAFKLRNPLP